jgi:hypothetical protein
MKLIQLARLIGAAAAILSVGCSGDTFQPNPVPCQGADADGNVTLCVPASTEGFQLATPIFDVPGGHEVQNCYFFRVPDDGERNIDHIEIVQNTGSHHMNIFRVQGAVNALSMGADDGTLVAGEDGMGECFNSANWSAWPLVVNSQQSSNDGDSGFVDWTLPMSKRGQVVERFEAGELLMLQTHYVNAATQKSALGKGRVLANFYDADKGTMGPVLTTIFATHPEIEIRPDIKGDQAFDVACNFAHPDVTIVGANSHFHSRGVDFTISTGTKAGDVADTFYENKVWDEPKMAFDLSVGLKQDLPILYTCTYEYPKADARGVPCPTTCEPVDEKTPSCGLGAQCEKFMFTPKCGNSFCFGPIVETMEHCNAFIYLYADAPDATFEGSHISCF